MSIQGVQPKLSAVLRIKDGRFEVVDRNGRFLLARQKSDPLRKSGARKCRTKPLPTESHSRHAH